MNTNFSATIQVIDVVPGCCSIKTAEKSKENIRSKVKKTYFTQYSFKRLFDDQCMYRGSHFCYHIYVMRDGKIKLYINEWEADTYEEWGSRLYELLITFNNVINLEDFPNLEQYVNKFNKYNAENSSNLTLTQYVEKLKEYENKYTFKEEMEKINIEDLF